MRAVVQRVSSAGVKVAGETVGQIGPGVLVLLGIAHGDGSTDIEWLVRKIVGLRIFNDENGRMDRSLLSAKGEALVVSQFTLHAAVKKGNRPSYIKAAPPEMAIPLYRDFVRVLETALQEKVPTGVFGAQMEVSLVNDGPVTILLDTQNKE